MIDFVYSILGNPFVLMAMLAVPIIIVSLLSDYLEGIAKKRREQKSSSD